MASTTSYLLANIKGEGRNCVVLFVEFDLTPHLKYDEQEDVIIGFEELGQFGRTKNIAERGLLFAVQGLSDPFFHIISLYLIGKEDIESSTLCSLIKSNIQAVTEHGFHVKAIATDGHNMNTKVMQTLSPSHYFEMDHGKIYKFTDLDYILFSIAECLISGKITSPIGDINWKLIKKMAKEMSSSPIAFIDISKIGKPFQPQLKEWQQLIKEEHLLEIFDFCRNRNIFAADDKDECAATAHFLKIIKSLLEVRDNFDEQKTLEITTYFQNIHDINAGIYRWTREIVQNMESYRALHTENVDTRNVKIPNTDSLEVFVGLMPMKICDIHKFVVKPKVGQMKKFINQVRDERVTTGKSCDITIGRTIIFNNDAKSSFGDEYRAGDGHNADDSDIIEGMCSPN